MAVPTLSHRLLVSRRVRSVTSYEIPDAPRHAPLMSNRTPRAQSAIAPNSIQPPT